MCFFSSGNVVSSCDSNFRAENSIADSSPLRGCIFLYNFLYEKGIKLKIRCDPEILQTFLCAQ
jgi:hypothetical protein